MTSQTSAPEQATGAGNTATAKATPAPDLPPLRIGDTLTVVSGRIGGVWMAEDEFGTVYMASAVE